MTVEEANGGAALRAGEIECVLDARASLGEGLLWSRRTGRLYWVDILERRLHVHDVARQSHQHWQFESEVSALAERRTAPGLVMAMRDGWYAFDPDRPAPPRRLGGPADEPAGNRFNDGKCDSRGRFWAGTMDFDGVEATGALYCLDAEGRCTRHAHGMAVTNGPTWSADGRTMYFNDTVRGIVHACDFDADAGRLGPPRAWRTFSGTEGLPDGMCTDRDGRVWLAHWGGWHVSCHDPLSGAELARVTLPVSQVTNCAFGGPELRTLYITTARTGLGADDLAREPLAGALFRVDLDAQGVAPWPFAG